MQDAQDVMTLSADLPSDWTTATSAYSSADNFGCSLIILAGGYGMAFCCVNGATRQMTLSMPFGVVEVGS